MSNLPEERLDIEAEEVQFRATVGQSLFTRVGQSVNFINRRQYDTKDWNFNGRYALGVGVQGADGFFPILRDMEIIGVSMYNRRSGTSGTTEVDITWLNGPGSNQGSIFSTTPKLDSTSPNDAYLIRDVLNSTDIQLPTGGTSPVLSKTNFNAGDALLVEISQAMSDAEDLTIIIQFRPR